MSSSSYLSSDNKILETLTTTERQIEEEMRWALKHYFKPGVAIDNESMSSFVNQSISSKQRVAIGKILHIYSQFKFLNEIHGTPLRYMITAAGVKYANEYATLAGCKSKTRVRSISPGGPKVEKKEDEEEESDANFIIRRKGDKICFEFDRKYLAKLLKKSKEDGVIAKF